MHESNIETNFYFIFFEDKNSLLMLFCFTGTKNTQIIMGHYTVTMRKGTNID